MVKSKIMVLKRSGESEALKVEKISDSIFLAAQDVGGTDKKLALRLAEEVVERMGKHYGRVGEVTSVEIGDMVERVLLENSHYKTAKAYILNRDKKRKIEAQKRALGILDDVGLSLSGLTVLREKYARKGKDGEVKESVSEVFERVADFVANAEKKNKDEWKGKFLDLMKDLKFLPGGRTLANAGDSNNQLANCFVMPMPDDIEGIFESVKDSSILKKYGGGVGFNFGHVRPKGDDVATTSGAAAGPVALMKLLDDASDIYLQAGKRRSGNMVTLPVTHPDIIDFIHCKDAGDNLANINYSISATSKFMKAVESDEKWDLVNPRTAEVENSISARAILKDAARLAWKTGDPGVIFIDKINKDNPTAHVEAIETVNLCGEQPLLNYEACNLGSINLAKFVKEDGESVENKIDWDELERVVSLSVRFLDDVVSVCEYPLEKVSETVRGNRKIGLGVMGWADMLVKLEVGYDSEEALDLAEKVMGFVQEKGWEESEKLGKERGSFPNFKGSLWEKRGFDSFRNATVTTIAPTGSISMVAGASGGIEPHFALAYFRKSMDKYDLPQVNQDLVRAIKYENGLYSEELMDKIAAKGSVQDIDDFPENLREVYVTSMDIDPEWHVKMQAAFQKHTDNAVSKTINLPSNSSIDDAMEVFLLAEKLGCKGITVYRDGSKKGQVLSVKGSKKEKKSKSEKNKNSRKGNNQAESIKKGDCPQCGGKLVVEEGCRKCYGCGFSVCG